MHQSMARGAVVAARKGNASGDLGPRICDGAVGRVHVDEGLFSEPHRGHGDRAPTRLTRIAPILALGHQAGYRGVSCEPLKRQQWVLFRLNCLSFRTRLGFEGLLNLRVIEFPHRGDSGKLARVFQRFSGSLWGVVGCPLGHSTPRSGPDVTRRPQRGCGFAG
jgi:hypothetical protein